jgi:uncharacterized phiE125 gp8 family phage protein
MFGRNGDYVVARVITPPEPFITRDDAKAHLRIEPDVTDDDAVIDALVSAATAYFDGPVGRLGRAIAPQLLELALEAWPDRLDLPCPPLLEIESIQFVDSAGQWQEFDPAQLPHIKPRTRGGPGDVVIRYWAGYGVRHDETNDWVPQVPAPIKYAALSLLGHWFAVREAVNIGNITSEVPLGVQAIVDLYRMPRC